jgi:hypothetical protein
MSRRTWTLVSILGLLLCSGFLALYFHVHMMARPPAISGTWGRGRHANEAISTYRAVSTDPNHLPAVLIFGENGTFSLGDSGWVDGSGTGPSYPLFHGGTYTWVDPEHLKLTIGLAEAIYTIRIEPGDHPLCNRDPRCNHAFDHLILHNEGGIFVFEGKEIVLEM